MKYWISLLLAMLLALSLVCCSKPQKDDPIDDTSAFLNHEFSVAQDSTLQIALTTGNEPQWTTLVDVSDSAIYGTGLLSLSPTLFTPTEDNKVSLEAMLRAPVYSSDGRPQGPEDTINGPYDPSLNKFVGTPGYGVRALGLASGVTDRETDYVTAAQKAAELAAKAQNAAVVSMYTHGSALANIVVKKATQPSAVYTQAELDTLKAMVNSLLAAEGALSYIEQAYLHYILGYVASAAVQTSTDAGKEDTDSVWYALHSIIREGNGTLVDVRGILTAKGVTLPAELEELVTKFEDTKERTLSAQTKLDAIAVKAEYTWEDISSAVLDLANVDAIDVNGFAAGDVMANMNTIIGTMVSDGLRVTTRTGGGVYADIADHCGDYQTNVTIDEIVYNGLALSNIKTTMFATSAVSPSHLTACEAILEPAGTPLGSNVIKEVNAFVFDLSFLAPNADTELYLKTGEGALTKESEAHKTQSTMSFSSDVLKPEALTTAIGYIRIVFFDTENGTILAKAKLDAQNALLTEQGVVAALAVDSDDGSTQITPLLPNEATKISVLVYVDADQMGSDTLSSYVLSSMNSGIRLIFSDTAQ